MIKASGRQTYARDYIASLAASGRHNFTTGEANRALGGSPDSVKLALNRLARKRMIASPARGLHLILPPEYRALGCLPADQFIPVLMRHFGQPYYVGLLSAAQYYGAAHQRPQVFQVVTAKARRPIHCGKVRVEYIVRKRLEEVPVRDFNTPRGTIRVSTPEATAVDVVGYPHRCGGLDQVTTVLSELAERLDSLRLVEAARPAPLAWAQRLGYLLELVGASECVLDLKSYVGRAARRLVPLLPGAPRRDAPHDALWKLIVNAKVEAEE